MMIQLLQSHDGRHSYKLALMRLALDRALNLIHFPFHRMIDFHTSGHNTVGLLTVHSVVRVPWPQAPLQPTVLHHMK